MRKVLGLMLAFVVVGIAARAADLSPPVTMLAKTSIASQQQPQQAMLPALALASAGTTCVFYADQSVDMAATSASYETRATIEERTVPLAMEERDTSLVIDRVALAPITSKPTFAILRHFDEANCQMASIPLKT